MAAARRVSAGTGVIEAALILAKHTGRGVPGRWIFEW
jgi:hypothetical protein